MQVFLSTIISIYGSCCSREKFNIEHKYILHFRISFREYKFRIYLVSFIQSLIVNTQRRHLARGEQLRVVGICEAGQSQRAIAEECMTEAVDCMINGLWRRYRETGDVRERHKGLHLHAL